MGDATACAFLLVNGARTLCRLRRNPLTGRWPEARCYGLPGRCCDPVLREVSLRRQWEADRRQEAWARDWQRQAREWARRRNGMGAAG